MATVRVAATSAAVLAAIVASGCSADDDAGPGTETGREDGAGVVADAGPTQNVPDQDIPAAPRSPEARDQGEVDDLQITIRVGDEELTAAVDDTAAAGRDLVAQLPQTVEMTDHGGVEKTGRLRSPLSLEGQPDGADPAVGDLGYYAPGNDLVLYYGDQGYYRGIVVLGRLDRGAADRLAQIDGELTVVVSA